MSSFHMKKTLSLISENKQLKQQIIKLNHIVTKLYFENKELKNNNKNVTTIISDLKKILNK